jgi:hypothetical protein
MANFFFDPSGTTIDTSSYDPWAGIDWSQFYNSTPVYTGTSDILGQYGGSTPFDISQLADPSASIASSDPSLWSQISGALGGLSGTQLAQLGLGVGSLGLGLGTGLASLFGGGTGINGEKKTTQNQLTPQQQQALASALSGLQQIQNIGLTGPTAVANVIGSNVIPSQAAYQQGLSLLSSLAPQYAAGLSPLQVAQNQVLGPLSTYTNNLLSGNMQIPAGLQGLVDQAYQAQINQAVQNAVTGARNQGFAGGAELLARAPASGPFGTALAGIEANKAQSLLDLLTKTIPQTATNVAGAYNTPAQNQSQFAQNWINSLQGAGQQGITNQLNFLNQAMGVPKALGEIGTSGAGGGATATQTTNQSTFNQLNSLLGSLGQTLGTLGNVFNG